MVVHSGRAITTHGVRTMVVAITHCYPTEENQTSGIWLKRLFENDSLGVHVVVVPKNPLKALKYFRRIREADKIIACWAWPAGCLAWLSRRPYVLYAIGLDVFMARDSWFWRQIMKIVARRARRVVFCGEHTQRIYYEIFGDEDTDLITLPAGLKI